MLAAHLPQAMKEFTFEEPVWLVAYKTEILDAQGRTPKENFLCHTFFGDQLDAGNVRVLQGNLPLAYCVPGREARVVLSDGALRLLDREQVDAVLAHEQTHLRHRHEVVMESFTAFYRAVPAPLRSRAPLDAVHLLLEMVADDAAGKRTGPAPLRGALERLTDAVPLAEEVVPERDSRRRRMARLASPQPPSRALTGAVVAAAVALLVLPTVILVVPWLDQALAVWPL